MIDLKEIMILKVSGTQVISLRQLRTLYKESHVIGQGNQFLFINPPADPDGDDVKVEFALMDFHHSEAMVGADEFYSHVFSGRGYAGPLREMRHTYWGDDFDGYTFFLPGAAVIQALTKLGEYFDL